LAQRGLSAFADLLGRGVLDDQTGFQTVGNRQQALGKTLNREFAGLGDFIFRASALARKYWSAKSPLLACSAANSACT
jgi:hypothetical protein